MNHSMFRRALAALLAYALWLAPAPAFAEAVEIAVEENADVLPIETTDGLSLALDGLPEPVISNEAQPEKLSLRKSATREVVLGRDYQIVILDKTIKSCKSGDKSVATVTKQGLIHTLKPGTVKITVNPKKGSRLKLTLKVIDPTVPTAVTIREGENAVLAVGATRQLTAVVTPATAPQDVAWKSSDKAVAIVNAEGLVSAVGPGLATITAKTGNKLSAALLVEVRRSVGGNYLISHAMGGIDGNNYSNCLEGFQENYAEGHRVFEVDLLYTSDGRMVLWHHWDRPFCSKYKKGKVPTYEQFMNSKIYDRYTPMDLEDLLKLMRDTPDIRVVTDSKCTRKSEVKKQFRTIGSTAKALGAEEALDRLVVEIYTREMFDWVDGVYHFKEYMMTLYKLFDKAPSRAKLRDVAKFCQQKGIATVAMYADWWKAKYAKVLKEYNRDIALYTVNDPDDARRYFDEGVTTLFTDFLPPL